MEKKLPPQVRQRINKLAHALSVATETSIHTHLTEQARDILFAASAITEADWAAMAMTPADWQKATMTDDEVLAWLTSHAVET